MFGNFLDTFENVWKLLGKLWKRLETCCKVVEPFGSFLGNFGTVGKMWQILHPFFCSWSTSLETVPCADEVYSALVPGDSCPLTRAWSSLP